jgi:hypothetical protein
MRYAALAALAVATVGLAACEQQAPDRNPTAPDAAVAFAKGIGGPCDDARARLIGTQQADLWVKPALDEAKAMFALATANCPNPSAMLNYIQWTIDNRLVNRKTGATDAMLLTHWNTVFPYAGYTGDDQPASVPTTIFTVDGAAKVIDGNQTDELTAANAAMTVTAQEPTGDQRDHLFVIYPISPNCLTGTNLRQSGPCFQFSSFPHVTPKFDPAVKVGICQPLHDGDPIPLNAPALGHLEPLTRITAPGGTYPLFCEHVASAVPAGSWHDGIGGMVRRLAWMAKMAVTPEPLYAVHGGLGGIGTKLSPFGAADLEVFHATFANDVVGLPPGAPGSGTWTQSTKSPGTILVQSALGQSVDGNLAVLDQGGGNCAKCLGLLLQGNIFTVGSPATEGIYDAEWVSLQDNANMKEAVFVLRDTGGRDIARVTYAVRNNVNLILYNDTKTTAGTFVGNWVQHTPSAFKITVDLDAHTTSLTYNGSPVAAATGVAYVNTNAANLATISADFRGIDSGVVGWDEIKVSRMSDLNH